MNRPLDRITLEQMLVRHASPTLAAIKPACLFNVPGVFSAGPALAACGNAPASSLHAKTRAEREAVERRKMLAALVAEAQNELQPLGVSIEVLVWRGCGTLVYVYRADLLGSYLQERRIAHELALRGYLVADLAACIAHLKDRLVQAACRCSAAHDERQPHEIGFFLGYPFEDVMGFIEHEGRNCLCFGCWKVYANPEAARRRFAQFQRCTERFRRRHERGVALPELVRLGERECAAVRLKLEAA